MAPEFIASSTSGGIAVTEGGLRLVCGFIAGDCFTLRAAVLVETLPLRRPRFEVGCALFNGSDSPSTGDRGSTFDPSTCCALMAGEFNGLKNSLLLTYSGILKFESSGVCAGETSGVKESWPCSYIAL